MKRAGFDGFMLANNHIADYGEEGLEASITKIIESQSAHIGATCTKYPHNTPLTYRINNTKVMILNAAESQFGTLDSTSEFLGAKYGYRDCFGYEFICAVQEAKKQADVLICVIHAGLEEVSYPLPQFRDFYKFLCDMGADCIIAHHPHVIQGYEDYQTNDNRMTRIFYSLGNFFFSYTSEITNPLELQGLSVVISFKDGRIDDYELIFSQQNGEVAQMLEPQKLVVGMDKLNAVLQDSDEYESIVKQMALEFYPMYMEYYNYVFFLTSDKNSLRTNLKILKRQLFRKNKDLNGRQALLLHNINIPTHRFVQELYLKYNLYYNDENI